MFYDNELRFLCSVLKKHHISTLFISPNIPLKTYSNISPISMLINNDEQTFYEIFKKLKSNTVYKLTLKFNLHYCFIVLPHTKEETVFLVGPYTTSLINQSEFMELAEKYKIPPHIVPELKKYYSNIPIVDLKNLFMLLETFNEHIWGNSSDFDIIDINNDEPAMNIPFKIKDIDSYEANPLFNIQSMEKRYAYENEIMDIVTRGQVHKATHRIFDFSPTVFESRSSDPVRNIKNYCIITNTLCRKAAEYGGVHPVYLDNISSSYAFKIEQIGSLEEGQAMIFEMINSYCLLVKKHSTKKYSNLVQNTIMCIESDLSSPITLNELAKIQNISAPYLSSVFKKETGETVTEYIIRKKLELAKKLLSTTKLQIQTVAQHCGFVDLNYFSKIFKKHIGKTPSEYRKTVENS